MVAFRLFWGAEGRDADRPNRSAPTEQGDGCDNRTKRTMRKFNSLRKAIETICSEEGWLVDCFRMVHQPDCIRKWCFTNGRVCFEIDTNAREVNYYRTTKFMADCAEIVGII